VNRAVTGEHDPPEELRDHDAVTVVVAVVVVVAVAVAVVADKRRLCLFWSLCGGLMFAE